MGVLLAVGPSRRRRNEIADKDAHRAHEGVAEPTNGVDLDGDGGGVEAEELLVDAEHELVVPRRVVVALGVHDGGELALRVDPGGGVGSHFLGHELQVLARDDVYF